MNNIEKIYRTMNTTTEIKNYPTDHMPLKLQRYGEQQTKWPVAGKHIMAQFDHESIYVYQAYRPSIAGYAVRHQQFGGDFSFNRMSWIKPNFLWMMYRSGWAFKEGQEHILAIRMKRPFFEELLRNAVASSFDASRFPSHEEWRSAVADSDVRLQWDPDHDPLGKPLERRAVQLGIRGETLDRFGREEILGIYDISDFVFEQRALLSDEMERLMVPEEAIYTPIDKVAAASVGTTSVD